MPPPPPRRPIKKSKAPTAATPEQIRSRRRGALMGLAVGEAMGLRNEQRNVPANNFPELNAGPQIEPRAGNRFELKAGQVTWGTEMAQVLTMSLQGASGVYDIVEVGKAYARWLPKANPPECVPAPVKAALEQIVGGRSPEYTGKRVWLESFQTVKDNAPLVRGVPLGVFLHDKRDARVDASLADCSITHFDPVCQLACTVLNSIIAAAIGAVGEHLEKNQIAKIAETELSHAAAMHGRREPDWTAKTKIASDWLREDIAMAQRPDPQLYGPELHLFFPWPTPMRTTFRLVLWELFHAPSVEAAVLDVANRGGDSDTNAAVTGAVLGAVHGEKAIPELWMQWLIEAPGGEFHPSRFIELAG